MNVVGQKNLRKIFDVTGNAAPASANIRCSISCRWLQRWNNDPYQPGQKGHFHGRCLLVINRARSDMLTISEGKVGANASQAAAAMSTPSALSVHSHSGGPTAWLHLWVDPAGRCGTALAIDMLARPCHHGFGLGPGFHTCSCSLGNSWLLDHEP